MVKRTFEEMMMQHEDDAHLLEHEGSEYRSLRRLLSCVDHYTRSLGEKRKYAFDLDILLIDSENGVLEFASNRLRRCHVPQLVETN